MKKVILVYLYILVEDLLAEIDTDTRIRDFAEMKCKLLAPPRPQNLTIHENSKILQKSDASTRFGTRRIYSPDGPVLGIRKICQLV